MATWLAGGCKRAAWKAEDIDYGLIDLEHQGMVVVTGSVGEGAHESVASYALIDAVNKSEVDVLVTVAGNLLDGSGRTIAPVRRESLRMPAGGRRTFALVTEDRSAHPEAVSAKLEVVGALKVDYPPPVVVGNGHVHDDRGRAVVAGDVTNTADRPVRAIVVGSFYDADRQLLERPSTMLKLDGHGSRGVQFVGPDGSRSAYLFIGEVAY